MVSDSITARAYYDVAASNSKMSRPEILFNNEGYLLLKDTVAAQINIEVLLYEWMSFNLPGGKYTPDFFVMFSDGTIAFVEVKQVSMSRSGKKYYAGQSYRDSRSKLRAAAELNPWFRFYMASYNNRTGWNIETIIPSRGIEYIQTGGDKNGRKI
jgi:hypothetical protein